jgi:hypothetical protein
MTVPHYVDRWTNDRVGRLLLLPAPLDRHGIRETSLSTGFGAQRVRVQTA